jgi:hypothetical protein
LASRGIETDSHNGGEVSSQDKCIQKKGIHEDVLWKFPGLSKTNILICGKKDINGLICRCEGTKKLPKTPFLH